MELYKKILILSRREIKYFIETKADANVPLS
jgi:hypothetical protein